MNKEFEYNAPAHIMMADVIEANVITDKGKFRREVMSDLRDIFGSVSPFRRAQVFVQFLNELDKREIKYNKKEFNF